MNKIPPVRPLINTERIKRDVQRKKDEQAVSKSDDAIQLNENVDFIDLGEDVKSLMDDETRMETVESAVVKAEGEIYDQITQQFGYLLDAPESTRNRDIPPVVANILMEKDLNREEKRYLYVRIVNHYLGHGILQALWNDKSITEIMGNAPNKLYVEIDGKKRKIGPDGEIERYKDIKFKSIDEYNDYIQKLFSTTGRNIDKIDCMETGRLADGSRLTVSWYPVANPPVFNIRKPTSATTKYTFESYIKTGAASNAIMLFLERAAQAYLNTFILGKTGSSKTTVYRLMIEKGAQDDRFILAEDSRELDPDIPHFVSLQTVIRDKKPIGYTNIVQQMLRMLPDRMGIQEIRSGDEALGMLEAMNAGHDGFITTGHVRTPKQLEARLIMWLKQAGLNVDDKLILEMIYDALDIEVYTRRFKDGSRKITAVYEVLPSEAEGEKYNLLFKYNNKTKKHEQCGYASPYLIERFEDNEIEIPEFLLPPEKEVG
ncbi:ATPase, T2SS/T4P/T4SS family [Desulfitobacterium sp. AusDCA]|uniref:ATPase, T2SS/T4P/T4SS family n=1 Tax=Desulfitobacterium sp. AusDCA TaxID=3240383 RepID=UPI003DA75E0A